MSLALASLGSSVRVLAEADGLWIRSQGDGELDLSDAANWPLDTTATEDGKVSALEVEQLLEQGFADTVAGGIRIPYSAFPAIRAFGLRIIERWTDWSPFMLSIAPVGDFGRPDFTYRHRFFFGATEVKVQRIGYFVRRIARVPIFHLDDQTYALLEAIERFNGLPRSEKTLRENWLTFSVIKGCAMEVGAALDVLLQANEALVPSKITLKIRQHDDGSISFVPRCSGVPVEQFEKTFVALPSVEGVYSIDLPGGGRLRVVLDDEQQEVLRRMKRVQRLGGDTKREAIRFPEKFFDGLLDRVDLPYGRRVVGVGDFEFTPTGWFRTAGGGFLSDGGPADSNNDKESGPETTQRPTQLVCMSTAGEELRIDLPDDDARRHFGDLVRTALGAGQRSIQYDGVEIKIEDDLLEVLLRPGRLPSRGDGPSVEPGKYLLIYTDEEDLKPWDLEAARDSTLAAAAVQFRRPDSLHPDVRLKEHQEAGVWWLQRCMHLQPHGRRGALLADDMGLGKTLQVLTYLAWAIEQGHIRTLGGDIDSPPWRPILVVAPLILVEDGAWEKEMQRFFKQSGATFDPICILHGRNLDRFRASSTRGKETLLGCPSLDAIKLMQHRMIITNYETVKNYQHSFAQTVDGTPMWSILVTDEAQEFKTPSTKISHAIKALEPDFHIACTGTPVENRLLDIWNIFDAIQPALLGTAKEFTSTYEELSGLTGTDEAVSRLKDRLLFGKANAFLLRRDKRQVLDLLPKREVRILCDMSAEEVESHTSLVAQLRSHSGGAHHLEILHRLSKLYQHPALLRDGWAGESVSQLMGESAKLRLVVEELHRIRQKREKALIFARFVTVQQMLAHVLSQEFGLNVKIINGETARGQSEKSSGTTLRAKETRSRLLSDFKAKPGFNILILSPFVAGVGLNITEANHVFHYGRWWNPAVEAQATDRAYRIGQEKEVSVYFPILRDAQGRLNASFDESLDQLLQRKSSLARDFLHPQDAEELNAQELGDLLRQTQPETPQQFKQLDPDHVSRLSPSDFEALVACLYEALGYQTVLTCQSNDGGADVVAVGASESLLIQVKHSAVGLPVGPAAVEDLLAGHTVYQNAACRPFRMAVVSNARMSPECVRRANECGVELIDGAELSKRFTASPVSLGEIVVRAAQRARSFAEGVDAIRKISR